jgi:1-deoxy-D-xylulose-5-phosphate synthase
MTKQLLFNKKDLLDNVLSPSDIKALSPEELDILADQIRERILHVLSKNGGHLSSNLGVVELTTALHYVFNSPIDKFIFDTSHQTYTHKIITGRNKDFSTLRQFKGICGFAHPEESKHDHFYSGHAGTSLSTAIGLVKNRDFEKRDEHIISVIGDASLTCGLTLEALNNLPKDLKKFIVILNDNKMAISKNVGHMKNILSRLINSPISNKIYQEIQILLSKIPTYGEKLAKQGQIVKESIKHLVSQANFFEHFGLSYIGPIDGHDIKKLISVLKHVKEMDIPTIIHVVTTKGKGLQIATQNPTPYHGVKPFDKESGKFLPTITDKKTFPQIFGKHLLKLAKKKPNLFVLTPAMAAGSCLGDFSTKYPKQFLDVGIAEGHCVTYAAGLSYKNKCKVICSIYSTFLPRAFDNIFHDICLQNLPVTFAIDRAGISGNDGCSHHGVFDISFLNAMPNMIIAQPRNGHLLKELLDSSMDWKSPSCIRYPNIQTNESNSPLKKRELAKAQVLEKGKEVLIIPLGHMCDVIMQAKDILNENNIFPTIVDPIFIKPLDKDLFSKLVKSYKYIFTVEEHVTNGGFASIFNSFISQCNLTTNIKIHNFGIGDYFVQHGSNKDLLEEMGLDCKSIAQKIISIVQNKDHDVNSAISK